MTNWKSANSEKSVHDLLIRLKNLVIVELSSDKPSPSHVLSKVSIPSTMESMYLMFGERYVSGV